MAQNIFNILKDEHRSIKKGLTNLMRGNGDFKQNFNEIISHTEGEEENVYPIMREHPELKDMIIEATEEHRHAKMILNELNLTDMEDETFRPKLKVLKEMIEHHIKDEEKELFPKAKKIVDKELQKDMMDNYLTFKENFMG